MLYFHIYSADFNGIFENGNTSIDPGPPGYFGEAKYSIKINCQLMLSIAMDSNAYPNKLNPNLLLTISPLVINPLYLMGKGGCMKSSLEEVHGCRHGGWILDWFCKELT
jgi:hypothetical protein